MNTGRTVFAITLRLLAQARIQQVHPSLPRPSTTAKVLLPRPVSLHGFCSTHLPGQLAEYRNVPASHVRQFVSTLVFAAGFTQYMADAKRPRLAHHKATSPTSSSPMPGSSMPTMPSPSIWINRPTPSIPRPSIFVFEFVSLGQVRRQETVKLHTLIDLHGNIHCFIHITDGKTNDVNALDEMVPEPAAFYMMDRGYFDFRRLHRFTEPGVLCHSR